MKLPKTGHVSGFTLIELLVVILIIAILMLAIMPIYGKVQLRSRREATQALIYQINASLERYKNDFDCYPPNAPGGVDDDGTLFESLNGANNRGITANPGTPRERHYEPYLTLGKENLKASDSGKIVVVDAWGTPIHYFNCKAYIEEKNGSPTNVYNPASVDLYSYGQDKKKDEDLVEPGSGEIKKKSDRKLVDDITNF